MPAGSKLLEAMRSNPRDWRIADVERLCREYDIACTPPRKGSHYKLSHPAVAMILTVPAHRPIKPVYIRELIRLVGAIVEQGA